MRRHEYLGLTAALALVWAAFLALTLMPAHAAASAAADTALQAEGRSPFFIRANVFSDDPETPHDPRHEQPQTGAGKMFAPIGVISSNHRVPHQYGPRSAPFFDAETAFLVSPCLVLTAYHGVFGNAFVEPDASQDHSMTFHVMGNKSRAVPVRHGPWEHTDGGDWALLRLDTCLGEDPKIGWTNLAPLNASEAVNKTLSIAGYPSDRSVKSLWRQDKCHFYQQETDKESVGLWTTDCATQPRASGSPIFYIENGVLNVVGLMHGHTGEERPNEVIPHWDPGRANLAVDAASIVASDPGMVDLIQSDIARFHRPNPARVRDPVGRKQ